MSVPTSYPYNYNDPVTGGEYVLYFDAVIRDNNRICVDCDPLECNHAVQLFIYLLPCYFLLMPLCMICARFIDLSNIFPLDVLFPLLLINIPFILIRNMCSPFEYMQALAFKSNIEHIFPNYHKYMSLWRARRMIKRAAKELKASGIVEYYEVWT